MKKNIRFTLVILLTYLFTAVQGQGVEQKINPKDIKLLIDSLSNALNRWYIYPDKAALMINSIKKNYKSGDYAKITSPSELSRQLFKDIQKAHKDKHMNLEHDPEFAKELETPWTDSMKNKQDSLELNMARETNFGFVKTEILPGNIGYLRWDGFCDVRIEESKLVFKGAFQFVKNCEALIVDMRYNGGGSGNMVLFIQSHFFNQKTRMNDIVDRNNDTVLKAWTDPAKTDLKLNMPVYVLTSRRTFSGAEDFVYGLQQTKRAIIVGDTTGGGAHPNDKFSIGQGFVLGIPFLRSVNVFSKGDWEGIGVRPDIYTASGKALEKVQTLLLTEIISKTKDQEEKIKIEYNLKSLRLKLTQKDSIKLTKEILLRYCGEYIHESNDPEIAPLSIILNCDDIYIPSTVGTISREDTRLIPVSFNTFIYDDNSGRILEFKIGKDGIASSAIFQWWTGVSVFNKSK